MARDAMRRLLASGLGAPGRALLAWRTRRRAESLLSGRGLAAPAASLAARLDHRVQRGPFAGMTYPRRRGDIVHAAKLLGAYERELHEAVASLVARAPRLVVNVGSGDGYYVVGLARALPQASIVAVDPDPLAQRACAATARANGVEACVSHVVSVDAAGLAALLATAHGPSLVVADCEGYEDPLLDPARSAALGPLLAHADLLVETHDFATPGVTARLTERLRATHDVQRIEVERRDAGAYPELASLPDDLAAGLLDEFRHHPQSWLVCLAREPGR